MSKSDSEFKRRKRRGFVPMRWLVGPLLPLWIAFPCQADPPGESLAVHQEIAEQGETRGYEFGQAVDVDGDVAIIGVPKPDDRPGDSDQPAAVIFRRNHETGKWEQEQKLHPADAAAPNRFGDTVSISQDRALVGAHEAVYVFERTGDGTWRFDQKFTPASSVPPVTGFGLSAGIDGNTIVIGAPYINDTRGAAFVYQRERDGWKLRHKIQPPGAWVVGLSVAIEGNFLFVSDASQAAVLVFKRDRAGMWQEVSLLRPPASYEGRLFGLSVAASRSWVAVGAITKFDDNNPAEAGEIHVFRGEAGNWRHAATLGSPNRSSAGDFFARSLALEGNNLIAGSITEEEPHGNTHLFCNTAGVWEFRSTLQPKLAERIGQSVAISGGVALIGAPRSYPGESIKNTGAVYSFIIDEIAATNRPPAFISAAATTTPVGQPYEYNVRIADSDEDRGDQMVITLDQGPPWLSLEQTSNTEAKLSGTATAVGTALVRLSATDLSGLRRTQIFTLEAFDSGSRPEFSSPPKDIMALSGKTATFEVKVESATPVLIQWKKDGAPLEGETDTRLTIRNLTPGDEGNYTVVASSIGGLLESEAASLTVISFTGEAAIVPQDYPNIQSALRTASEGSTIFVTPGTYSEELDFAGRAVTLRSLAGPETTTIFHEKPIKMGPTATIEGFTIQADETRPSEGAGIIVHGENSLIKGNFFTGHYHFRFAAGIQGENDSSVTIEDNIFADNFAGEVKPVISLRSMKLAVIRNNLFHNNFGFAIEVPIDKNTSSLIENNTVVENAGGLVFAIISPSEDHVVRNNIIAMNTGAGLLAEGREATGEPAELSFRNNLVFGNGKNWDGVKNLESIDGNFAANPQFVSAAGRDYRLAVGSPAIDAGDNVNAVADDLAGNSRPFGRGVDLGAYEFVPPIHRVPGDFETIQAAIEASADGDTVLVFAGTYRESLTFLGKDIDVRSVEGSGETTLQGAGGVAVTMGPRGTLTGFTIVGAPGEGAGGLVITGGGDGIVKNNVFHDHRQTTPGRGAAITVLAGTPLIEANLFYDNDCTTPAGESAGAVVLALDGSAPAIVNNIFADNACPAVALETRTARSGVANNTIVRNPAGILVRASGAVLRNNLLAENGIGISVVGDPAGVSIENNLLFSNNENVSGISDPIGRDGNLSADPQFFDPGGRTFRLRFNSPAIDAGSSVDPLVFDFAGTARPMAGGIDIGAIEAPVNRPPTTRPVEFFTVNAGARTATISLRAMFHDPDGVFEELALSVAGISVPALLSNARISGDVLIFDVPEAAAGSTHVTVKAIDPGGLAVSFTFTVTVVPALAPDVPNRFGTIQEAIDASESGTTLVVAPGTYTGAIDFQGKNISVRAQGGPEVTVLDGTGKPAPFIAIGPGGTLEGFTIANVIGRDIREAPLRVTGAGSLIRGNIFENNAYLGRYGALAIHGEDASPVITRNIFRNNHSDWIDPIVIGVVVMLGQSSPVISNNLFVGNERSFCIAISFRSERASIFNNTFADNLASISVRTSVVPPVIRNNISVDQVGFELFEAPGAVIEHNLVMAKSGNHYLRISDQTGHDGNISSDPLFVDPAAGNYRLRPESPAVDAGADVDGVAISLLDFDGNVRPVGRAIDIGAFELKMAQQPSADPLEIASIVRLPGGAVLVEFPSLPDRAYEIQYGPSIFDWTTSPIGIQASEARSQWIDSGSPATSAHPNLTPQRYYRVLEVTGDQ